MKKKYISFFVIFIGTVLLLFSGCEEPIPVYTVKYEITGPETVATSIRYRNSTGNYDTINDVNVPWSLAFDVSGKLITLQCSGSFLLSKEYYTAKIYVNNIEVASSTNSGPTGPSVIHIIK